MWREGIIYLSVVMVALVVLGMLLGWLEKVRRRRRRRARSARRHRRNVERGDAVLGRVREMAQAGGPGRVLGYLRKIDPYVFEEPVLSAFERAGWRIERNAAYSGDGGIDGKLYGEQGWLILIQCKRYGGMIDPGHVTAFAEVVAQHGEDVRG